MHLITGATGFVGQRLLKLLDNCGTVIRLLSRARVDGYETIVCDFTKGRIPARALDSIDTVFHLAGYAHDLRDTSKNENLYRTVNINATISLAKLAAVSGVKKFIFVSSVKAGGIVASGQCMSENDQYEPEGIYGKTKREAEIKLLEIGRQSGMLVTIVRPALVYGHGVKGNLQMMLSGISKGWFPPLPEVGNCRSMIHVDDLVRALLLVVDSNKTAGQIYIATDGKEYSSREIYETMTLILGKTIPKWQIPKFILDFSSLVNSRIRHKLNKLFADECYSSEKLQSIGFRPQFSLKDMNEEAF